SQRGRVARGRAHAHQPALSRSAPHDLGGGAHRRGGRAPPPRGGTRAPPGGGFSRTAPVCPPRPRGASPARRGAARGDLARAGDATLPGELHVGRRDESVSLRILQRPTTPLPLFGCRGTALPEACLRAVARPHRPPRRDSRPRLGRAAWRAVRRVLPR